VGPVRRADGLGWASAALGVPMLALPRRLLETVGIRSDPRARAVLAAVGVRELAATGTILGLRHRRIGAWSRVAGDTLDLALLGVAFRTRREDAARLLSAVAFIAAIFAVDLFTAVQLNQAEGAGVPDGSTSQGVGAQHPAGGGPARVRTAVTILAATDRVRAAFREFHWSALDPNALEASGQARFRPAPGDRGTELHLDYEPDVRGGNVTVWARKLVGRSPDQAINDELRRFKAFIETGVEVRSEKTPASFSARGQIFQRPAQPPEQSVAGQS
jgi:uncharacterized membrane protein